MRCDGTANSRPGERPCRHEAIVVLRRTDRKDKVFADRAYCESCYAFSKRDWSPELWAKYTVHKIDATLGWR